MEQKLTDTNTTAPKKLLLVDNMELALKMEEEILRRSGLEILTARSGSEALELTRAHKPDLVLLEKNMPEMTGDLCCRNIKADPELRHIPVLLMISDPNPSLFEECYAANCEEILVKPFEQNLVIEKITNLLHLQTRKLARLNLVTPVRIERAGEEWQGECVNLNRRGILIKSERACMPFENHRLSFALSPADQNLSLWSRLERQVNPGEEKNPGNLYLALFRFLNLPEKVGDRIDKLAEFQTKQSAKPAASKAPTSKTFALVQQSFLLPLDLYQSTLMQLVNNLDYSSPDFSSEDFQLMRLLVASLKVWEKKALGGQSEDDQSLVQALAIRMKLTCDLKKLQSLQNLAGHEQDTLRTLQKEYFGLSDQVLDNLQTRINAKMQSNQIEVMKQFNQTKTDTFKNYVAIKSTLNRILDPKAAAEALQFHDESAQSDAPKVTAFARAKPVEEKVVVEDFRFKKQKKGGNRGKIIFITVMWIIVIPSVFYYFNFVSKPSFDSKQVPSVKDEFKTLIPMKDIRNTGDNLVVILKPEWDNFDSQKKESLAQALWQEAFAKGYKNLSLHNHNGMTVGYLVKGNKIKLISN